MMNASNSDERTHTGVDKVARYGWVMKDTQGTFRMIHKRLLNVNREVYQREATKNKVKELASNWSWVSCGALIVASREGIYWVIDGQHRKLGADKRSDITDLPCMVFDVVDVKDEARAFLDTNANRKPVSAIAKFRAQVVAGDPAAELVRATLDLAGLRMNGGSSDARVFSGVAKAMHLAQVNPEGFIIAMKLCGELAADGDCPIQAKLLDALHYIHLRVKGGLEEPRLRKRIKQLGAHKLVEGANKAAAYYAAGGAKVWADGMMQTINHGLQNKIALIDVARAKGDE